MYDKEFRKLKQSDPELEWHETYRGALDTILDGVMGARDFQPSSHSKDTNDNKLHHSLSCVA